MEVCFVQVDRTPFNWQMWVHWKCLGKFSECIGNE